ncbi:hypothetical protein ACVIHD_001552 [Bradyrhizobium embrapense]
MLQQRAFLTVGQHLLDDVTGLVGFIADRDEQRLAGRGPIGPQVLGEAFLGERDHAIGGRQDRLRRAVVAVERDDLGGRAELAREVEDVSHGGGAERVDRLCVVADDGEPASGRLEREQDGGLQAVGVLIFVDHHMVEAAADLFCERRIRHHLRPVEQEVVIIEHVLALLRFDIGREQLLQLAGPAGAPREELAQHGLDRHLRVDAARIDRKAGAFGRKPAFGAGEAEIVADQVDQVGGVLTVMDREGRVERDTFGEFTEQPRADAVEGAGPTQRIGHDRGAIAEHAPRDALDTAGHLGGGAPRKGHQQDAARIGTRDDQMRDPMGERVGLAGACTGDHQQRRADNAVLADAVLDGAALLGIERIEIGCVGKIRHESPLRNANRHCDSVGPAHPRRSREIRLTLTRHGAQPRHG